MDQAEKTLLRNAFIRAAVLEAAAADPATTARALLQTIIRGKFTTDATNGRTVISTSEAGGTVTFTLPDALSPAEVMIRAEQAIEWLERQEDPDDPDLTKLRSTRRYRATFHGAQV
jgi:hypothetical protein